MHYCYRVECKCKLFSEIASSKECVCVKNQLGEDSSSFNGDPPHLTLNHGFPWQSLC